MRAVVVERFGPPEALVVKEVPDPDPTPDGVVVRVLAAGICYHDVLDRAGKIPGAEPGSILGHEVAGEISRVGEEVRHLEPGQRVVVHNRVSCATCRHCLAGRHDLCRSSAILGSGRQGGYAEYVEVPACSVVPISDDLEPQAAALAVCPIGTSYRALAGVANVRPGDRALVTGASGGLGLHQIQIAKALGARVIAITGSESKAADIRDVGADDVVVSRDGAFSREVWELTGKTGVEVVMENVTTSTLPQILRCMAPNGVAVVLGNIGVHPVEVDPGLLIGRRLRIVGSGNPTFDDVRRSVALIASGRVRPRIARVLPFDRAAEAHAAAEDRRNVGRVVLSGWAS